MRRIRKSYLYDVKTNSVRCDVSGGDTSVTVNVERIQDILAYTDSEEKARARIDRNPHLSELLTKGIKNFVKLAEEQ